MIKIPYDQIVQKIKEETGLSEDELQQKITAKTEQLSGLISKEGAAHIIANELGVKLSEAQPQTSGKLQIANIIPGLRNVETLGKVTAKYELRTFQSKDREGKVASFLMADETGTIRTVMWGDQAEQINNINEGSVVKVVGAYVRENNNNFKELHLNDKSKLIVDPPGETVNAKVKAFERKALSELQETDESVEVLGTIVQVFDPRFFEVDPKTGKRVQEREGAYYLGNEIIETPDYSYVLNVVIDDGTSNMRAVFFREQMEKLLNKNKEQVLSYKENPQSFEDMKTELLGNLVKIRGRAKRNMFFDRLELMANSVTTNPDPEDEIKRLDAEVEKARTQ